ncbi:MAG: KH domain-containing protein [Microcystaceae cyanobacterium]
MPNPVVWSNPQPIHPQYHKLAQFLIEPLLDNPSEMKIDCEPVNEKRKIWIRVAFDDTDKGRVYGRGGRNLQAIRMVLENAAAMAGQSIYLDIFNAQGEMNNSSFGGSSSSYGGKFVRKTDRRRSRPRGSSAYNKYTGENSF